MKNVYNMGSIGLKNEGWFQLLIAVVATFIDDRICKEGAEVLLPI